MKFKIKVRMPDGEERVMNAEAPHEDAVKTGLAKKGITLLGIKQVPDAPSDVEPVTSKTVQQAPLKKKPKQKEKPAKKPAKLTPAKIVIAVLVGIVLFGLVLVQGQGTDPKPVRAPAKEDFWSKLDRSLAAAKFSLPRSENGLVFYDITRNGQNIIYHYRGDYSASMLPADGIMEYQLEQMAAGLQQTLQHPEAKKLDIILRYNMSDTVREYVYRAKK